jgi:hypothetical protein
LLDASLPACEDWDIWIRIAGYYEFAFVPDILAIYNIHGKQMVTHLESIISAKKSIIEKNKSAFNSRPRILAKHLKKIASLYCLNDMPVEGRKYFMASMRSDPFNYGNYFHLCLSLLSSKIHKKIINRLSFLTIGDVRVAF